MEEGRMTEWGQLVVDARRGLGLRQAELADLAGVSERFVRELESGKTSVRLDKVLPVLAVLGLELRVQPRETP